MKFIILSIIAFAALVFASSDYGYGNDGALYGATPFPTATVIGEEETACPTPTTNTIVRKCTIKDQFKTIIKKTVTEVKVETDTVYSTVTTTVTEGKTVEAVFTTTVTGLCTTSGAVLGEEETPTTTYKYTTAVLGEEETPTTTAGYGYGYY